MVSKAITASEGTGKEESMNVAAVSRLLIVTTVLCSAAIGQTTVATPLETRCADLIKMQIDNTSISKATALPEGTEVQIAGFGPPVTVKALPAHCWVQGETNHHVGKDGKPYGDKFEVRMPSDWSGRLLFQGGGGLDGVLLPALGMSETIPTPNSKSALTRGYAVISTDGGHHAENAMFPDGSFGADPEARADYNYRSTKLVTDVARKIIAQFYGRSAHHAYFKGCSNGGREGLIAVQRYPEYFDGVIAGSPAFNLTHAAIAEAWNTVQFAAIAPRNTQGVPELFRAMTDPDLKLLANRVLQQCDELDGLKDGLINNPEACHFDPAVLQCSGEKNDACLTPAQVGAVRKAFGGPKTSQGKPLYSDWPFDSGVADMGWRIWVLGNGMMPAINTLIFPQFFNGLVLAGTPPPIDIFTFNFDSDPARVEPISAELNATSPDLSAFQKRGGKLLLYIGMSDPVFSPNDLIRYYNQVVERNGGMEKTAKFARLFLIPGMNHCGGGPALDTFDSLTAIQDWVEEGKVPAIIASGTAFPGRTRPLCAYPKFPQYKGNGNPEDAANFNCVQPVSKNEAK